MNRIAKFLKTGLLLVLWIVFFVSAAEAVKGDKRKTLIFSLENGLDVVLVSDPDVHRSAAALSVGTGYLYDPNDKAGLAHYLEHMLFLGTKKYPEVGSYKKFLDSHSGGSNAYTGGNITNYFFEVSHDGFNEALDRFSDFFKAPLFDKTYAKREVKAVNNEHEKNKLNDGWRGNYVAGLMSEPGHPLANFGTGNQTTLSGDNQPALLEFYKRYYSASNMKLALISSMPMEVLSGVAQKYFSNIPNRPVKVPQLSPDFRKPLKGKYRLLKLKTIKDIRSLEIDFPTIRLKNHQASKPASIVGSVLGYEGKGSLLSKLKEEGLVLSLSAGGGSSHPDINSFGINISLTEKGLKEYERILELIFSYINMVREHGFEEYTFKETQAMAQINFDWKNPDEGMGFVSGKAALMQDYKLKDVETLPFLFTEYEPSAYKAVLDTLNPENAMVVLSHNLARTDSKAPYYDAEYALKNIGGKAFSKLSNPGKVDGVFYPAKNDFIPYNLNLVEEYPHLVQDDERAKVWFKYDHRFKQPKIALTFRIETPKVYRSAENLELAKLYEAMMQEGLNELVYPIQMAGLSYALSIQKRGVVLSLGGYSERIGDLIKLVTKNLKEVKVDKQKFANIKEAMIRGLKNKKLGQAYSRGGYYNWLMLLQDQYTEEEKLAALTSITLSDLKGYAKTLYDRVYITGMVHGNWSDDEARQSVDILLSALGSEPLPENERFEQVVEVMPEGERFQFSQEVEDNNNSLAYAIQVGEKGFPVLAQTSIIASIVESDFYTQMRTNQQLGYIVWSFHQRLEERIFFRLVIQSSTHGPFEMSKRVNGWLASTEKLFADLTDQEFARHQQSLIVALEKEGDSIGAVAGDLYTLATDEKGDFRFKKKLIQAIRDLKKTEVALTAGKIFRDPVTPRLEVLMRAKGSQEKVPEGVIAEVSQFKNRLKR
ncbi:MAG: insulinase family protein [Nitrospinae bacterium]|nr:insulinase family protein [Nitrospinota bacterium]MBL7020040.1 insulinase family protein [Nitrospinaceae bacterium]